MREIFLFVIQLPQLSRRMNGTPTHTATLTKLRALQQNVAKLAAKLGHDPALVAELEEVLSCALDCNVNAAGPHGSTPLLMCCTQGVVEDTRALLAAGASPTLEGVWYVQAGRTYNSFPLLAASFAGHIEVVRLLVEHAGTDHSQVTTDNGRSTLYIACEGGRSAVVRLLLSLPAVDVNKARTDTGGTPLFMACQKGHTEVVGLLLACDGIEVNKAKTTDGATPLFIACQKGHTEAVGLLLACDGIDVNKATTTDGITPLFMACVKGHIEVVGLLLACDGIDVNKARTTTGVAPLHTAARRNRCSIVQQLVVFGANMSATTHAGITPQKLASKNRHPALAAWLGVVAGWSPLRVAAGCRLHRAVILLLRCGRMDPDALPPSEIRLALEAATTPATELPWEDAPDVCPATAKLIKAASQAWTPITHWLHHVGVRTAAHTMLLVSERLHQQSASSSTTIIITADNSVAPAAALLPILPPEMWVAVTGFFLRRHWPATIVMLP
jgi:ankyrin repeat protein